MLVIFCLKGGSKLPRDGTKKPNSNEQAKFGGTERTPNKRR